MPYYTPLRYPGGKRRLAPIVARLLEVNQLKDIEYAEPFAGGASIALALLFGQYTSVIHINDLSRPVYAFWYTVLNDTAELCRKIECVEVTMPEWHRQRAVYDSRETADLWDLGFATLFLNRTNRSGIIGGGVIGGKMQAGEWTLDARFNKSELIKRIRMIGRYRSRIKLYQLDALDFTNQVVRYMGRNSFVFYDPPYIENGNDLYLNNYTIGEHRQLATNVARLKQPWVVTYDRAAISHGLYQPNRRIIYQLHYSAQTRYGAKEIMFLSEHLKCPKAWDAKRLVNMVGPRNGHPLYGRIEA